MEKLSKYLLLSFLILLSGCQIASNVEVYSVATKTPQSNSVTPTPTPPPNVSNKNFYFNSSTVNSSTGYKLRGSIGNMTVKKTSSTGYTVTGGFYE